MDSFKTLFGADPTRHKTVGSLLLVSRENTEEADPEVTVDCKSHLVSLHFPTDFLQDHGSPVMIYTMAGLGYQPNDFGFYGTLVFMNPQYIYLVDGDSIPDGPPESADVYKYDFNFGGALVERVKHIRPGWRFAVQAAVIYADGTIKLTDWDFLEVV